MKTEVQGRREREEDQSYLRWKDRLRENLRERQMEEEQIGNHNQWEQLARKCDPLYKNGKYQQKNNGGKSLNTMEIIAIHYPTIDCAFRYQSRKQRKVKNRNKPLRKKKNY